MALGRLRQEDLLFKVSLALSQKAKRKRERAENKAVITGPGWHQKEKTSWHDTLQAQLVLGAATHQAQVFSASTWLPSEELEVYTSSSPYSESTFILITPSSSPVKLCLFSLPIAGGYT
jgi:hypothetical protein